MSCKFQSIPIDEEIMINISSGRCLQCEARFPFSGEAIYRGHIKCEENTLHIFDLKTPYLCPKCRYEIVQYHELCQYPPMDFIESRDNKLSQEEVHDLLKVSIPHVSRSIINDIVRRWRI